MSWTEIFEIGGAILISLGGASAVLFGFSSWLGKIWAERILTNEKAKYAEELEAFKNRLSLEAESHKIKLKKSEFIFSKEFEAASKLVSLNRDIVPSYSHPSMDWYDACDDIARDFDDTEKILRQYLKEHGAILPSSVKHLVTLCYGIAGEHKFDATGGDIPSSANNAASILYGHLKQAEEEMIQKIEAQVSI